MCGEEVSPSATTYASLCLPPTPESLPTTPAEQHIDHSRPVTDINAMPSVQLDDIAPDQPSTFSVHEDSLAYLLATMLEHAEAARIAAKNALIESERCLSACVTRPQRRSTGPRSRASSGVSRKRKGSGRHSQYILEDTA